MTRTAEWRPWLPRRCLRKAWSARSRSAPRPDAAAARRKERSLPDSLARGSIRPSCRPVPWSLTAAEALAKFFCRPVRDDRVTFRGRMESAAGRAARKVEHAEGSLIEVVLRPLIDGEKDVPAYAWFVWDRDASGSELKWFKPGYKARFS